MTDEVFEKFYKRIEPNLKSYELIRIGFLMLVLISEIVIAAAIIYWFYESVLTLRSANHIKVIFVMVIIGSFIYSYIKKEFEIKIKKRIIEDFMECFSDFDWECWTLNDSQIDSKTLKSTKILPNFQENYSDDNFVGTYKGISVKISEQTLKVGQGIYKTNVFNGIVIEYDFKDKFLFPAEIIVKDSGLFAPKGYEKVILEDADFNRMFNVYSNNQIECRYILTVGFMEKLKALKILFDAKSIALSFFKNHLYIAVDIGRDSFNIAKLGRRTDDKKLFEKMYNQFDFILKISDLLQLTRKI